MILVISTHDVYPKTVPSPKAPIVAGKHEFKVISAKDIIDIDLIHYKTSTPLKSLVDIINKNIAIMN